MRRGPDASRKRMVFSVLHRSFTGRDFRELGTGEVRRMSHSRTPPNKARGRAEGLSTKVNALTFQLVWAPVTNFLIDFFCPRQRLFGRLFYGLGLSQRGLGRLLDDLGFSQRGLGCFFNVLGLRQRLFGHLGRAAKPSVRSPRCPRAGLQEYGTAPVQTAPGPPERGARTAGYNRQKAGCGTRKKRKRARYPIRL
jgi:hypothetical protein